MSHEDRLRTALDAVRRLGSVRAAARETGIPRRTLRDWVRRSSALEDQRAAPEVEKQAPALLRSTSLGSVLRVLAVGDAHDEPALADKRRFSWLGQHARAYGADQVVLIGDLVNAESVSDHPVAAGVHRPTFLQDMKSLALALDAFIDGLDGYDCPVHITLGNHERRIWRADGASSTTRGMFTGEFIGLLEQAGITWSPFGAVHMVGGVGFVHAPLGLDGEPIGGKTAEQRVGNEATHDLVSGHTHRFNVYRAPKLFGQSVTVVNCGSALPDGHVQHYARHRETGWTYGVTELLIAKAKIQSVGLRSMLELEHRYGGK